MRSGPPGLRGAIGATGATGGPGKQGFTGSTGYTGWIGFTGDTGPPGGLGPRGPQGIRGMYTRDSLSVVMLFTRRKSPMKPAYKQPETHNPYKAIKEEYIIFLKRASNLFNLMFI